MMRNRAAFALLSILWLGAGRARAQSCPAVVLEPVVSSGLSSPTFVTHAGDATGRLLIVEQPGAIRVLQPGSSAPTLFLRIPSAKITAGGERGLLGLAFHPDFENNRRFFIYYTRTPNGGSVIAEYRASAGNPDVAEPTATNATETVLLSFAQPFANHNGGSMAFGPDGFLYIATGDGGGSNDPGNRAQNVNTFLGKILRIDVDTPSGAVPYSSPPDNPYFGPTAGLDEIFAIGLRNPWRMSFDRVTGRLLAGDVGQRSREEVSLIDLGGNYGWRVMEGTRCNIGGDALPCGSSAFTPPAIEYTHGSGRCAVTGGYVYRGGSGTLPDGTYVYGDFCTGEIFGIDFDDLPLSPGSLPIAPSLLRDTTAQISSFGEDEEGELYLVALGGQIQRLIASIRLSPASEAFDEAGGAGAVDVASPAGCPPWIAVSNDPWIAVTAGGSGDGNGTVSYSVAANPDVPPRTGSLTIAGRTFEVEQAGGPAPTISIDDVVVGEGPGAQASFTVTLSLPSSQTVSLSFSTANGTATGKDYDAVSATVLTFDPGELSKALVVEVEDDLLDEDDETFFVHLANAQKAAIGDSQGMATLTDDDPLPEISIADRSFGEGFGVRPVPFLVTLSQASGRTVSVDYVIAPGTATPGTDFGVGTGTLVFPPGSRTRRFFVWTKGDRVDEANEDFLIDLQGAVNATIADPQATGTILDDDLPPRPRTAP